MSNKLYSNKFAYDLANKILTKGEIFDYDVINQSIENILSVSFGERLFNNFFGSSLGNTLFEGMTNKFLNSNAILKRITDEISIWEDRITFKMSECSFTANPDNNEIVLILTYIINKTKIKNTFKRMIRI